MSLYTGSFELPDKRISFERVKKNFNVYRAIIECVVGPRHSDFPFKKGSIEELNNAVVRISQCVRFQILNKVSLNFHVNTVIPFITFVRVIFGNH